MPKPDPDALAAALRENLRKRKEQARGAADTPPLPNTDDVPSRTRR